MPKKMKILFGKGDAEIISANLMGNDYK